MEGPIRAIPPESPGLGFCMYIGRMPETRFPNIGCTCDYAAVALAGDGSPGSQCRDDVLCMR